MWVSGVCLLTLPATITCPLLFLFCESMIVLFQWWDMLVPWGVHGSYHQNYIKGTFCSSEGLQRSSHSSFVFVDWGSVKGATSCTASMRALPGLVIYYATWRNIPVDVSGDRITPIYKPWSSAIWKGSHNPILRGRKLTMVINHLLSEMILQVLVMAKILHHLQVDM